MKEKLGAVRAVFMRFISMRSLRARIFILIILVGIIPSVLIRGAIMDTYEQRGVEYRTTTVQNQLLIVANHLISNNYLVNYRSDDPAFLNSKAVINAELEMISNLYEGRVMIINSNCKIVKDTYGISEGKTIISEEVIRCFRGENVSHYDAEHGYIEMTTPIIDSNAEGADGAGKIVGVMLTSVSNDSIVATMEVLSQKAGIILMILVMVILALALLMSAMMTRPFDRVSEEISKISAGHSDGTISVPDYAETVHIVDAFNKLLGQMKVLDDSRQDFVANVSHELKTPMTSLKVLADSLLMQEEAPAELYREFMTDMVSEIDRENQIINDLLALVKMDKKAQELNIVSLNINELTELILKRLRPIARKMDVELVFESIRPVVAEVDEVKLTLAMTNLVENAIKYNKEHGWVKVVLDADYQNFILTISDSGLGIPEESLAHVYERFYRVDKSHSREIGGTGLGLAITKSAILMHKGSITVSSIEGEGTTFEVRIPLNYIATN